MISINELPKSTDANIVPFTTINAIQIAKII